jgi:predicted nuclease of restriction endonuclease-like (RecB) superfamily
MGKEVTTIKILSEEVTAMVTESKAQVAQQINVGLTLLYWNIGHRIKTEILKDSRATYGQEVILTLSKHLTENFGRGWSKRQLHNCIRFVEIYPNIEIVHSLSAQLSWTHIRQVLPIENELKRTFYVEMCQLETWSYRQLKDRIRSMLYERTAISRQPEETIKHDLELLRTEKKVNPDLVFRDPYLLDFLGLSDSYAEKDLESAILVQLQQFIIEIGSDFAFMARQKRIIIDSKDFYIDLLFYHRRLKCLVAIDLKIGDFEAGFKGQMELYLRYLEKYEMVEGENTPIGLILCTGKNKEHIELLQLDKSNIRVAEYYTVLPNIELLEKKLHQAILLAKQQF